MLGLALLSASMTAAAQSAAPAGGCSPDGPKAALRAPVNPIPVAVGESRTEPIFVTYPAAAFQHGQCEIRLRVSDGRDFSRELTYRLLGPQS